MDIPFFFHPRLTESEGIADLSEDTARHVVSVLRMREGEAMILVDGQGAMARAEILQTAKKRCSVRLDAIERQADKRRPVTVAVSPVKNTARYEWMLEKLAELGVKCVVPLLTERTVRERMRADRLESIAVSAMIQSQQAWMTEVASPCTLPDLLKQETFVRKYIAHCLPESRVALRSEPSTTESVLMLIGPEGDFTSSEIGSAVAAGCIPVTLGDHRLRTETAALVASVLLSV
jgi:16S rRNA (uracil1498-N3)-methyltransferase